MEYGCCGFSRSFEGRPRLPVVGEHGGARDDRVFPLWAMRPDGTAFEPFSGFGDGPFAHHFITQISDGSIVVCRYYNLTTMGSANCIASLSTARHPSLFNRFPLTRNRCLRFLLSESAIHADYAVH